MGRYLSKKSLTIVTVVVCIVVLGTAGYLFFTRNSYTISDKNADITNAGLSLRASCQSLNPECAPAPILKLKSTYGKYYYYYFSDTKVSGKKNVYDYSDLKNGDKVKINLKVDDKETLAEIIVL